MHRRVRPSTLGSFLRTFTFGHVRQLDARSPAVTAASRCSGPTQRSAVTKVRTALRAGADVSVTVRLTSKLKAAIATIADDAWTAIE